MYLKGQFAQMQGHELYPLIGVPASKRIPDKLSGTVHDVVDKDGDVNKVYIMGPQEGRHRILVMCPSCTRLISFGRIWQHRDRHVKRPERR